MEITLQAAEKLTGEGHNVRVVSLPSTDIFDAQDEAYRESVLPGARGPPASRWKPV
ncbi:transketolase 2 [Salmonella enterica subsp. enterica serovar Havana]|nr:transketolase 2 [Salmonella enterica subsp. enterica serovar Havana]